MKATMSKTISSVKKALKVPIECTNNWNLSIMKEERPNMSYLAEVRKEMH